MTNADEKINKAIRQLDWYFEKDDGTGAEAITKESYYILKEEIVHIAQQRDEMIKEMIPIILDGMLKNHATKDRASIARRHKYPTGNDRLAQ